MFVKAITNCTEEYQKQFPNEEIQLGLWLQDTTQTTFGEIISQFAMDLFVLGSLRDSLNTVMSRLFLMQTQNINIGLTLERKIAPTLLKSLYSLLQQLLEAGLDD